MLYLEPSSVENPFEYDVAIYGAGPAGITLALALANLGVRVGLFEAGGVDSSMLDDVGAGHPYRAENTGRPYNLAATRARYLGGTSSLWGGWCRPLDSYDFEDRPFIPVSGWPIDRADLDPYYESAINVCEVDTAGLGLAAFEQDFDFDQYSHKLNENLRAKNFLFSPPTRFGERYRQDLERSENIDCILDATLINLSEQSGQIDFSEIASLSGVRYTVQARFHVIAMGAVENARTLLHSELANSSGYVGRCFSDHLGETIGIAILSKESNYYLHNAGTEFSGVRVLPHLGFSDEFLRSNELMNFGLVLEPRQSADTNVNSLIEQTSFLTGRESERTTVLMRMENAPNPQSRVVLTNQKDIYGVPSVRLEWQPSMTDFTGIEKICELLPRQLGIAHGRFKTTYENTQNNRDTASIQGHHMGTTRMSMDSMEGVVDKNLRTHDVENLFVAGSSVFPVFGFANPTLTIVALSQRLANHLHQQIEVR